MSSKKTFYLVVLVLLATVLSGCTLFGPKICAVTGKVTMGDGTVLANAEVYIVQDGKETKIATTDSKGEFNAQIKPGKYEFFAKYSEKVSAKVAFTVPRATTASLEPIKIAGLAVMSGTVQTSDGIKLEGATVKFDQIEAVTDNEGKYTMPTVSGTKDLTVSYKGYTFTESYTLADGIITKDIILSELAEVTINVKNKDVAQANLNVTVSVGDYLINKKTDEAGQIKVIAPLKEALVKAKFQYLNIDLYKTFEKNVTLTKTVELAFDFGPDFVDNFDNLDNWVEEEDFEYNQWAITTKGFVDVVDGNVVRTQEGVSGLKLKDIVVNDCVVAVKWRVTSDLPEKKTVGVRTHVRNAQDHWCYGYGTNVSTYNYELATWHGLGSDNKYSIVTANPNQPQVAVGDEVIVAIVVQGNNFKYYKNGELIAESTETEHTIAEGGIFLSFNSWIQIDQIEIYNL